MLIKAILFWAAYVGRPGNWFIVLKFLMLNVTMLTIILLLSKFGLGLDPVVDFLSTGTRAVTSTEHIP